MPWNVIDPESLQDVGLLSGLGPNELGRVAALLSVERYRRNDLIVAEGAPSDRIFFIRQGSVRVSRSVPGVGEEALAVLGVGSYFGEMSLFGGATTRSADVFADSSTTAYVAYVDDLRALLEADAELSTKFLWGAARTLAERLREANAKVMFLSAAGIFS
ncbi:MAG: cyclic nucleotide-binding domain-containing protein [Myxococcales bacterium]|nr:cyclic nucleotide-binding domain-containing protein [Myxococcales bacterium]MCB9521171.1 cyclic nucleotide-binding domain-containing protein [Myxococcales bacterium]MCB9530529.1 cyclic nucleotide-binding domain-containing protein [Myxococcales bacterium]